MTRKEILKIVIPYLLITVSLASIYYGAFLPFKKAQLYIKASRLLDLVRSVDDLKRVFRPVLETYSPIGQEETVKFTSTLILNSVSVDSTSEDGAAQSVEFLEPYMMKNNVRHLIMVGQMYRRLWERFGKEEYFIKSEKYLQDALSIGPKLPPVLYSLFELYSKKGDEEKAKKIGGTILNYWPDDAYVKSIIQKDSAVKKK